MTALRRFGLLAPLAAFSLAGCGLNSVPTAEEQVNAKWGNLQADYQRRADLIPNLVETVKGYAKQESSVLIAGDRRRAPTPASVQLNAERPRRSGQGEGVQRRAEPADARRSSRCSGFRRPIRTSSPTRTSSRCRTSSKAPRTASTRRAATITRRCRPITPASAPSRRDRRQDLLRRQAQGAVRGGGRRRRTAPTVDFNTAS